MKLSLGQWTSIAELLTSVAVVAGLVFVGVELHQNTLSAKMDYYQAAMNKMTEMDLMLAEDPELDRIVRTGQERLAELTESEMSRYQYFTMAKIAAWEFTYEAKQKGMIDEIQSESFDRLFATLYCPENSGFRTIYEETHGVFIESFQDHIELSMKALCME